MDKIISKNTKDTEKLASQIFKKIIKEERTVINRSLQNKPIVFLLKGELGGGKTVFVKALAKAMGVKEKVTSPTFILYNQYKINPKHKFLNSKQYQMIKTQNSKNYLVHWDLYRIEDPKELKVIGFWEIVKKANVLCIEWPDLMGKKYLKKIKREMRVVEIKFEYGKKLEERIIEIDW